MLGSTGLPENRGFLMQSSLRLSGAWSKARSTPILVVACSNSGLRGPVRENPAGYRTIILYRAEQRAFFVYGFPKNERDNIDDNEKEAFRKMAKHVLGLSEEHLTELVRKGQFSEVGGNDEEVS